MTPYNYGKWTQYWNYFPPFDSMKFTAGKLHVNRPSGSQWMEGHHDVKDVASYFWWENGEVVKNIRSEIEVIPADKPPKFKLSKDFKII